MPKVKPSGRPFWDGLETSMAFDEPVEGPTAREGELHALQLEIMRHPDRGGIFDLLFAADDLGLDTLDPGVVRQAIVAAELRTQRYLERLTGETAYTDLRASRRTDKRHPPIVYYMRMSDLVKIGTTTNIGSRLAAIGAQAVMAVEPGNHVIERERHRQFAHLHDHGEWFRLEQDLGCHVVDVRQAFAESSGETTEDWLAERIRRPQRRGFAPQCSTEAEVAP